MMHPAATRSHRSSLPSTIQSAATVSSLLHHQQQQQQQHIVYGPITSLQPCTTGLHPTCIAPQGHQNTVPLQLHGKNNSKWQSKNKLLRNHQQHCQQQPQLPYPLKHHGFIVLDQSNSNVPSPPASNSSFLVTSSTFAHGPITNDYYNNAGVALISPPYLKPPELQTFCLVQDRQNAQQTQTHHQQPGHGSYYNISATNTCSLQTVNSNTTTPFQLLNLTPYTTVAAYGNNQITGPVPGTALQPSPIYQNPPIELLYGNTSSEKLREITAPPLDIFGSSSKYIQDKFACAENTTDKSNLIREEESHNWITQSGNPSVPDSDIFQLPLKSEDNRTSVVLKPLTPSSSALKVNEDSDSSSTSFDYTIEAEKMVSALCNTSPNDPIKGDCHNVVKNESMQMFSGAGDNVAHKSPWFSDFPGSRSTPLNNKSIAVQTDSIDCTDRSHYAEMMRKTIHWGCTEAEIILNSAQSRSCDVRCSWLINLSSATKTAVTKSSTCFPVFAGDLIFINDLVNALLRISNGWLILDNYLNKPHYPSLGDKFNKDLSQRFHTWEESTHELLNQIVEAFLKLESDSTFDESSSQISASSFPGDVSLYTKYDLLCPSVEVPGHPEGTRSSTTKQTIVENQKNFYHPNDNNRQKQQQQQQQPRLNQKESKPRSKWTVTENLNSTNNSTKSVPDMSLGHADTNKFNTIKNDPVHSINKYNTELIHLKNTHSDGTTKRWIQDKTAGLNVNNDKILKKINDEGTLDSTIGNLNHTESMYNKFSSIFFNSNYFELTVPHTEMVKTDYKKNGQISMQLLPSDKVTLLSQIEPNVDKEPGMMAAKLSAWFASMRTTKITENDNRSTNHNNTSTELTKQFRLSANRQLQTLRNMQSFQSAPWNVCNFMNNRLRSAQQQAPDEYDSSEDVRVYMKPGSYNVPKKRYQRRGSNRRSDTNGRNNTNRNYDKPSVPSLSHSVTPYCTSITSTTTATTIKIPFPSTTLMKSNCPPNKNSTEILKPSDDVSQDMNWKAACASAGVLLEALHVKDSCMNNHKNGESIEVKDGDVLSRRKRLLRNRLKLLKNIEVEDSDSLSNYEASEDDSDSPGSVMKSSNDLKPNKITSSSVKTDSWLIRTLNNASIVGREHHRRLPCSDSSETSTVDEEFHSFGTPSVITRVTTDMPGDNIQEYPMATKQEENIEDKNELQTEKATYSETLRRSKGTINSRLTNKDITSSKSFNTFAAISSRKSQCDEQRKMYCLLHKSRKSSIKKNNGDHKREQHIHFRNNSRTNRYDPSKRNDGPITIIKKNDGIFNEFGDHKNDKGTFGNREHSNVPRDYEL